jgi:hypothetical protein
MIELDERDRALVAERMQARATLEGPQEGDFIRCTDGAYLRIAYAWEGGPAQTEDGRGSYHLCRSGHCSMSGSLNRGVMLSRLTWTAETREGSAWIFHHDVAGAGRGRDFVERFRVWSYDGPGCPVMRRILSKLREYWRKGQRIGQRVNRQRETYQGTYWRRGR